MDFVGVIMDLYRKHNCDYITIDKTGVGQGVYDRIKDAGYDCRGVSFGEKSEEPMFQNLKAEWYWRQRQWMLAGGRLIQNPNWMEFQNIKYKNRDGRIIIQPKEDLFREGIHSPNVVDAAVLTQCVTDQSIKSARILRHRGVFNDKMLDIWRGEY